jgi:hypothetical protein
VTIDPSFVRMMHHSENWLATAELSHIARSHCSARTVTKDEDDNTNTPVNFLLASTLWRVFVFLKRSWRGDWRGGLGDGDQNLAERVRRSISRTG